VEKFSLLGGSAEEMVELPAVVAGGGLVTVVVVLLWWSRWVEV
jgi:hypothetical protein